ncbi:MAG TPA: exodeoxyribonuclease III [Bacilli bacterium]|jgi:exodeoxyribonuclease-3|nr:exodeoxyribonuclease III [Bacilli bacterium]NLT01833.1 exodeoxyribonuclease III [Acholeplasmataceae bacterium]HNZ77315.1 exodeoxyribonuclease III [Bacilli bacterium]HOD60658.1 exodeoxyribonuclease III [Bacilli bacterium]HOE06282.1 exodeoxyribonuclease III [Bacilli bacterium]
MKFVTWNVNGLRACMKKGFKDFFDEMDADFFAIQETKMQEEQKEFAFPGYYEYWNSADKRGYSGTLIYTKRKPLSVIYGLDGKYNDEGRAITLEYENFYFVTLYSPNVQPGLTRLDYRMEFEDDLKDYLNTLNKIKPVIMCGDLNVAHQPIDLKNPKSNEGNPGYTIEERTKFSTLLQEGYLDTFRYLYPEKIQYTWWSYRFFAREKGIGWRIDYFITSVNLKDNLKNVIIHDQVLGSDHCPVEINIDL